LSGTHRHPVEVDGADEQLAVLAKVWAHQGPAKAAQKNKLLADALRLLPVASTLPAAPWPGAVPV